jgi:hypothetical protein
VSNIRLTGQVVSGQASSGATPTSAFPIAEVVCSTLGALILIRIVCAFLWYKLKRRRGDNSRGDVFEIEPTKKVERASANLNNAANYGGDRYELDVRD